MTDNLILHVTFTITRRQREDVNTSGYSHYINILNRKKQKCQNTNASADFQITIRVSVYLCVHVKQSVWKTMMPQLYYWMPTVALCNEHAPQTTVVAYTNISVFDAARSKCVA